MVGAPPVAAVAVRACAARLSRICPSPAAADAAAALAAASAASEGVVTAQSLSDRLSTATSVRLVVGGEAEHLAASVAVDDNLCLGRGVAAVRLALPHPPVARVTLTALDWWLQTSCSLMPAPAPRPLNPPLTAAIVAACTTSEHLV